MPPLLSSLSPFRLALIHAIAISNTVRIRDSCILYDRIRGFDISNIGKYKASFKDDLESLLQ